METIKRHKKAVIVLTVVLALILLAFGGFIYLFFGGQTRIGNSAIEQYYGGYYDVTPFAERGNVQKEFNYLYKKNMFPFATAVSSVLIADYSKNDFKEQKEFLESRQQIDTDIGENWSKESFSIHDWNFMVDAESEPPKRLTIFGFNEKKNKIAYIKFEDKDLDEINETPSEFFDVYIKYRFF